MAFEATTSAYQDFSDISDMSADPSSESEGPVSNNPVSDGPMSDPVSNGLQSNDPPVRDDPEIDCPISEGSSESSMLEEGDVSVASNHTPAPSSQVGQVPSPYIHLTLMKDLKHPWQQTSKHFWSTPASRQTPQ